MNESTTISPEFRKPDARETALLAGSAILVIAYLAAFVLVALAGCVFLLRPGAATLDADFRALLLCIVAGTLGSAGMALLSVVERLAAGWEIFDGAKWPLSSKSDRFNLRMLGQFVVRPFLGALVGFVTYVGVVGGYFVAVSTPEGASLRPAGIAFFAVLSGLFAKTMLERLKEMFKALVGAQRSAET